MRGLQKAAVFSSLFGLFSTLPAGAAIPLRLVAEAAPDAKRLTLQPRSDVLVRVEISGSNGSWAKDITVNVLSGHAPLEARTMAALRKAVAEREVRAGLTYEPLDPLRPDRLRVRVTLDEPGDYLVVASLPPGATALALDDESGASGAIAKPLPLTVASGAPASDHLAASPPDHVPGDAGRQAADCDHPRRVGGDIKSPTILHQEKPRYPPELRALRLQGMVVLEAVIDQSGAVRDPKVLGGEPVFGPAAIEALRQWRFRPAMLNGMPVCVVFSLTVNFSLK